MASADNADNVDIPKWKRDLLMRRRAGGKNKQQQLSSSVRSPDCGSVALGCAGHQPSPSTSCGSVAAASVSVGALFAGKCNREKSTCSVSNRMVQERPWADNMVSDSVVNGDKNVDSDSSEELQYGPGIVSKLKNRYLSLTLREQTVKVRPSILPLRKATSLENLLDDDGTLDNGDKHVENNRLFESRMNGTNGNAKNVPNRYRNTTRGSDMKRARSVETISRAADLLNDTRPKRESMHEDVFIIAKEGNDKPHRKINTDNQIYESAESKMFSTNNIHTRINRPKRIAPVMNEREKPPADVVKQTKRIFEARPELRTRPPQHTGEVAAKVASYKSIIIQTKVNNKPPIKQKPVVSSNEKVRKTSHPPVRLPVKPSWNERSDKSPDLTSPTDGWAHKKIAPPLPSPIPDVSMIEETAEGDKKTTSSLSETPDLILHSSPVHNIPHKEDYSNDEAQSPLSPLSQTSADSEEETTHKRISEESQRNISKASSSVTFNFNSKVPPTQPLKLEINGTKPSSPQPNHEPLLLTNESKPKPQNLSPREIEKNLINTTKSLEQTIVVKNDEQNKCDVPKSKRQVRPRQEEQNCVVFKFTDRKDVPDYIGNDGVVRTSRIERPKAGEGGITLLPGASIDESFTDYEEEMLSLEGPPSPCDVNFINDNILIDGRSSLSQKTKKPKMRIQFVEAVPQIFEYPSEASMLLLDDVQSPQSINSNVGHTVPSLSGSTLANYTPKGSSSINDDFQLGVTKTPPPVEMKQIENESENIPELDEPILFSSGTNTDILF